MGDRENPLGRETAPLLAAGLVSAGLSVAAFFLYAQSLLNDVWIGVVVGTLFGQVNLAAGWNALGPFRLISRLPLSATWIAVLILLIALGERDLHLQKL